METFFFLFCFLVIFVLLFLVLPVLFLVTMISLPLRFSTSSSTPCIDASTLSSMRASPPLPSFVDTYSLSTSFLGCNALYMVISLLILCSNCLCSSLVHFIITILIQFSVLLSIFLIFQGTCRTVHFAILADHRVKLKEIERKDKYLDLAREL